MHSLCLKSHLVHDTLSKVEMDSCPYILILRMTLHHVETGLYLILYIYKIQARIVPHLLYIRHRIFE